MNKQVSFVPLVALTWATAILIFCFAMNGITGCTVTGEPDWARVSVELELGADDMRDVATLIDDEELAVGLETIAGILDAASIQAASEPANLADTIEAGLTLCDSLIGNLNEEDQPEARAALLIARSALRRYRAYLPIEVDGDSAEE